MFSRNTLFAAAGLLAAVNGHMIITSPQPFTFVSEDSVPNRPLASDGSDFPCRNTGGTWDGPTNSLALGSNQELALQGTAVHGGGSCQMSITYDTAPTKDSVFKVIHTIQGGCPARKESGNLNGNSAAIVDPYTYNYTIPSDIPAGKAVIAWSWINRIGNREFYMNCGAAELTGTGGDQANFDKLPDLFVANLAGVDNGCTTDAMESMDPVIPNPGDSVEINGDWPSATFGAACKVAAATGGSGSGGSTATSAATYTTSAASATIPGGVFITKTTQAATTTAAAATTTKAAASSASSAAPVATATAVAGGSTSTTGTQSGACTTEGEFACSSDGKSFQQCASGTWSAVIQMAAGTVCTPGQSADMKIAAGRRRFARGGLRR